MSIDKIRHFRHNRRTGKVIETLAQKQKRETEFLQKLDALADKVLSGQTSGSVTDDEIKEIERNAPEVVEMVNALMYVAERIPTAAPTVPENDGSVIVQHHSGKRLKYKDGKIEEIGESAPVELPVTVLNPPTDTKDALLPPELPQETTDIAELVRKKTYRTR